MSVVIPFVRDFDPRHGQAVAVSPRIRRVVANNPGPFTFTGTGTYIVGRGEVCVIDPGPRDAAHLDALLAALEGERVTHILVTHRHLDHAPLSADLARATGAPILAAPAPTVVTHASGALDDAPDSGFRPDALLSDGDVVRGPDWTLRTVATPGHSSDHLAFALEEENALFSGDHVMGWSTTVVAPPDGDMGDYLASLRRVMSEGFATLWPTHGGPVTGVAPFLDAYLAHRLEREGQILALIARGPTTIADMVPTLYAAVDPRLWPAAGMSVLAHLIQLTREGRVRAEPEATMQATYAPA